MRVAVVVALILGALGTLEKVLDRQIIESNKLEVGLLIGWLIAKSGTVIDWLFGSSESGARRSDQLAHVATEAEEPKPSA